MYGVLIAPVSKATSTNDPIPGESYAAKIGDTYYTDLAEAVTDATNSAESEVTITILEDITLSKTLTISAGSAKTITFKSDGGAYTIKASDTFPVDTWTNNSSLIYITGGATVKFEGESSSNTLTLDANSRTRVKVLKITNGTVELCENAIVTGGYIDYITTTNYYGSVIYADGSNAKFVLNGGEVSNNIINYTYYGGTILGMNGAEIVVNSGRICDNVVNGAGGYYYSAGIMVNLATCTINGGTIENNVVNQWASAFPMYTTTAICALNSTLIMNDGEIKNNTVTVNEEDTNNGTIIAQYTDFTMNGGTISYNTGCDRGGGICVGNYYEGNDYGLFVMNGGTISNNSAVYGGGIYNWATNSILNAGYIVDNEASGNGGGVYSEGLLTMYNVLVSENEATIGGGIWACPRGDVSIYVNNGGMITNNTAIDAGNDLSFTTHSEYSTELIFCDRAFNGGKLIWSKDGETNDSNKYGHASIVADRYDATNYAIEVEPGTYASSISLHSETTEDEAYEMAEATAQLIITGNTAAYGGGIGTNGAIVIGKDEETIDVTAKKVWDHGDNDASNYPTSITLKLLVTTSKLSKSYAIETVTLTENDMEKDSEGNYTYKLEKLPTKDPNGDEYIYSISETAIEGYTTSISDIDSNKVITITNTYKVDVEEEPSKDENKGETGGQTKEDNTSETSKSDNNTSIEQNEGDTTNSEENEESTMLNYIDNIVKTGDQIYMFIIIAIVALIALIINIVKRKYSNNNSKC